MDNRFYLPGKYLNPYATNQGRFAHKLLDDHKLRDHDIKTIDKRPMKVRVKIAQ